MHTLTEGTVSDDTKSKIVRCWCRVLGEDSVSPGDDFFLDLGGTSLKAMQLLIDIETHLDLIIPMGVFAERPTLERLFETAGSPGTKRSSIVVPLQSHGYNIPFFFVHAGGGHTLFAQQLANALAPDQPMYGLQSRGIHGREKPLTTIPDMAAHYIGEIKAVQPQGPYRVGGFCMGAMLALEIACQLRESGDEVSHLIVFSTDARWTYTSGLRDQIAFHRREIGRTGLTGATRYVLSRVRFRLYRLYSSAVFGLNGLYERRRRPFPPKLRHVYVAELNYRASWKFEPRPFDGRIYYIQGTGEKHRDPLPFWQRLADGGIEVDTVPGYGGTLFDPPHVESLAYTLRECLSRPGNTLSRLVGDVPIAR